MTPTPVPSQEAVELAKQLAESQENPAVWPDPGMSRAERLAWVADTMVLEVDAALRAERERTLEECKQKHALQPSITITALNLLLGRIASWTLARWDQHLRYELGDEPTDTVLGTLLHLGIKDPRPSALSDSETKGGKPTP